MTALEKLQALARRRRMAEPELAPAPLPAPATAPATAPDPAPGAPPPLEAAVCFTVPGAGDVWLVPDSATAEKLGIPAGQWLTPPDLALLEGLTPDERVQVLVWMRETGGRLVAAPAPARRYGPGEKGWSRWRIESIDAQIREYRGGSRK